MKNFEKNAGDNKNQLYDLRFPRYRVRQTEFFVILGHVLPFYPITNRQNQNFEKMKNMHGDIILHMCTIHDSHIMYGS